MAFHKTLPKTTGFSAEEKKKNTDTSTYSTTDSSRLYKPLFFCPHATLKIEGRNSNWERSNSHCQTLWLELSSGLAPRPGTYSTGKVPTPAVVSVDTNQRELECLYLFAFKMFSSLVPHEREFTLKHLHSCSFSECLWRP